MTGIPLIIGTWQYMQHFPLWKLLTRNPSASIGFIKIGLLFIFLISGTISYFAGRRNKVSKSGTVPDNPGHMACMKSGLL